MAEALILIVDDQPDNSDTMMEYLRESSTGFKFLQALNGEIACKVAAKRLPDLIIMDWEMPVMNGFDSLIQIKNNPVTADIPIIMATGRSSGADLGKALKAGAADYIRKPIEKQELLARVGSCLSISRLIKQIKAKNDELKAYDQMVSHDLRGPIGMVYSMADLLMADAQSTLSEEGQNLIEQIMKQSKSSLDLMQGILNYASAEREEELEKDIDLNKIMKQVAEAHSLQVKEKGAQILVEILPVIEKGATVKIYQLFYNLVGNALKFQPKGNKPVIKIYSTDSEIVVEDNGIGFNDEYAERIFKPLERLDNSYDGFGIGLGTCKRIIDFHGWEIRAISEVGKGAKFIIGIK